MTNKSKIAKAGLGLLAGVVMFAGVTVSAMTQSQAAALVASLNITGSAATALVAALTTTTDSGSGSMMTSGSCFTFTHTLALGTSSSDVMQLQKVLNSDPDTALTVAAGAPGSAGHEIMTFGPATKAAVIRYQTKHTISPKSGFFGPITMASVNSMCTPTTTTGGTTTGGTTTGGTSMTGPVTVMLSSDNPQGGNLIQGQATADLAHFTFNGQGTVTQITLQRTGISDNQVFPNVYLYSGNTRLTDSASVNSNGQIIFNGLNLMVNGTMSVSLRADIIGTSTNSESTVAVTMTSYMVSGATAATAVNLAGNSFYINSGTGILSTVSVGTNTAAGGPGATSASVSAGTTNYSLWSAPVTVSLHTVWLKSASFRFIGSAPGNAFANLGLYANGVQIGTATGLDANSYINFNLTTPYQMMTGATTLEVRGDIVNGASRTAELTLQNASDLMVTDSQANVNVGVTNVGGATFTQNAAGTINIQAGTVVASIDPAFNAMTNVTGGATNVEIAGWTVTSYGEDVKINTLTVQPTITGLPAACSSLTTGQVALENVTLYYNGSPVGSSQPAVSTAGGCTMTQLTFNPGSNLTISGGTTGTFQVHADLINYAGTAYQGGTVTATANVPSGDSQGMTSGTTGSVTFPAANALNITTGSLTIGQNTGYLSQTIAPNTSGAMIGSFTLQNNSTSEAVQVNSIAVNMYQGSTGSTLLTTGTTPPTTNFSTMSITGVPGMAPTPIGQPTGTNTFSTNFTIPAGGSQTVNVIANLGSTGSSAQFFTSLTPTAVGANSRVTVSSSAVNGQVITLGTGSLNTPALISSQSTANQYVSTGGTGASKVAQNSYNFVATTGTAKIIGLKFAAYTNMAATTGATSTALVSGATTTITSTATSGTNSFTSSNWTACNGTVTCNVLLNTTGTYGGTNLLGTATWVSSSTISVAITQNMVYGSTSASTSTPVGVPANVYLLSSAPTAVDLTSTGLAVGTGSFQNGVANISSINGGSGVMVPNNPSGITLPVFISYAPVATNGGVTSGTAPTLLLEYVQYQSGSNTTTMAPAVGGTTITLVGSKPNIVITPATTGLTAGTDVLLGTVTVTADNTGDIAIASIPLNISISQGSSGPGNATIVANSLKLTDNNDALLSTLTATNLSSTSTATSTEVFGSATSTHYRISAGQSKTFEIRGTITGSFGTSASVSVGLGAATQFTWDDINGNNIDTVSTGGVISVTAPQTVALTGALLYSYPTGSVSVHN